MVAPWKLDGFTWRNQLSGAPLKLLVICILQGLLMLIGLIMGVGQYSCPLITHDNQVLVSCSDCVKHHTVTWQQVSLFILGISVLLVGVGAAILRNKPMCILYGSILLVYSFVIGLTSLLTGLDTIVLEGAAKHIDESDTKCLSSVSSMIGTSKTNAILYGVNCLLDIVGAIYAIKSKEIFAFQEIATHHNSFHRQYALL